MKKNHSLSEGEVANLCAESKPKLKLVGEDGNAFSIIGRAIDAARKAGWDQEKIGKFREDCMAGDYSHLLSMCADYFDMI